MVGKRDLRGYINPHLGRCLMLELERGVGGESKSFANCCSWGQGSDPRHLVCIVLYGHCLWMSGSSFELSVCWRGLKLSTMTDTHMYGCAQRAFWQSRSLEKLHYSVCITLCWPTVWTAATQLLSMIHTVSSSILALHIFGFFFS